LTDFVGGVTDADADADKDNDASDAKTLVLMGQLGSTGLTREPGAQYLNIFIFIF
jgi:hypothetical protein